MRVREEKMEAWGLERGNADKRKADRGAEEKRRIAARVFKIKNNRDYEIAAQTLQ